MNKQTEALKMAIEALDDLELCDYATAHKAIQACKEALEQPAPDWTCDDIDVTNCDAKTLEQFCRDNIRLAPFFAMLAGALKQPAQEPVAWISVKDRLPTEVGRYLVYVEEIYDLGNAHYIWNAGFNPNDGIFQEETMKGATVTHWMNLPNTPNGISHYINSIHPAPQPAQKPVAWECFSDPAYYDMWAIRQVGNRNFEETIHVVNGKEAKQLCAWLNSLNIHTCVLTHSAPSFIGLSDDEIRLIGAKNFSIKLNELNDADIDFARAIEQALKEKNT